jgi:hypothetical protein
VNQTVVLRHRMRTVEWRIGAEGHGGRMEIACLGAIAGAAIVTVVDLVSFGRGWMPEKEVTARMQ